MGAYARFALRLRLFSLFLRESRLPELRDPFIAGVLLPPILCSSDVCLVGSRGLVRGHSGRLMRQRFRCRYSLAKRHLLLDCEDLLRLFRSFGGRDSSIPFQSQYPQSSSPNADSFRLSEVLLHRLRGVCSELGLSILQPSFGQHCIHIGITSSFRQSQSAPVQSKRTARSFSTHSSTKTRTLFDISFACG
jgi:hypothetical protein